MRFDSTAYDELFPRKSETVKEKVESAVETFKPTEEVECIEEEVEDDYGNGCYC